MIQLCLEKLLVVVYVNLGHEILTKLLAGIGYRANNIEFLRKQTEKISDISEWYSIKLIIHKSSD